MYGDGIVTLSFIKAEDYMNMNQPFASSIHCFPIENDKVLFTVNPRGIDIIGGHVEDNETVEETLLREAKEEACIIPTKYKLVGAIEVDNSENPKAIEKGYPVKGYQLFYVVSEFTTLPFEATHECTDRLFVAKEDIAQEHHKWLQIHQLVLDTAYTMYNDKPRNRKTI